MSLNPYNRLDAARYVNNDVEMVLQIQQLDLAQIEEEKKNQLDSSHS